MTAEQLGFGGKTRMLFDFSRIFLLHQHEFREVISRRVLVCFGWILGTCSKQNTAGWVS